MLPLCGDGSVSQYVQLDPLNFSMNYQGSKRVVVVMLSLSISYLFFSHYSCSLFWFLSLAPSPQLFGLSTGVLWLFFRNPAKLSLSEGAFSFLSFFTVLPFWLAFLERNTPPTVVANPKEGKIY